MSGRGDSGARAHSGGWGRLKPVTLDPLEAVGLPSKGDNGLLNFKTQENYYTKIVDRYMNFCSDAGRSDELLRRMSQLSVQSGGATQRAPAKPLKGLASSIYASPGTKSTNALSQLPSVPKKPVELPRKTVDYDSSKDLSLLTMSMRKLREGIVASKRIDEFSTQAYIFCIRLSILIKHMESYHPALLHLLQRMHTVRPLSRLDLQEFAGYLVLDLACRQQDLAQAHVVRIRYGVKDTKILAVLDALAHDNYYVFWQVKRSVDGHKAKLMEYAEEAIRLHALKCLGRSYFTVSLRFLEQVTGSTWDALVKENRVGWELKGEEVIIRKPKTR
ncbi:hypothetical protein V500_02388 [Pseudogymnoascus sp. VKM F-4518 (FW-2643)]|nr:hypothetical protein V500_02388 [Pseudogymnoascus sp. VKM F-4518 (FW-2643)]